MNKFTKIFAQKVIEFNAGLSFKGTLPAAIRIMNPFEKNGAAMNATELFYNKYYNDTRKRHFIFGINPGRFGGGITGVPFTDTKRLQTVCGIVFQGKPTHEPSSVFVYEMIDAFGGAEVFYKNFYINSLCPLGFTSMRENGSEINYNYYDSTALTEAVLAFMIASIKKQISIGAYTDVCFCFGTGKNEKFFTKLNEEHHFFDKIIALEHPRFIMQYKAKSKQFYIDKYLRAFENVVQ